MLPYQTLNHESSVITATPSVQAPLCVLETDFRCLMSDAFSVCQKAFPSTDIFSNVLLNMVTYWILHQVPIPRNHCWHQTHWTICLLGLVAILGLLAFGKWSRFAEEHSDSWETKKCLSWLTHYIRWFVGTELYRVFFCYICGRFYIRVCA